MTNSIARLGELGIIPVVRLEDPTQGDRLAEALLAGGLPCAEITFRTAAAGEGIRRMCAQSPEMLVGAGTVVTDKSGKLWINCTGNPGMAKGGMGDALTGMIGAFLAQGLSPLDAARAGVFLHGLAGDIALERHGEQSLLASDLISSLGAAFAALD